MFEDIAFNLLSVHKITRKSFCAYNRNRNFHAISIRLKGEAEFVYQNKTKFAQDGDIAYFPANLDYTIKAGNEELIIIHLDVYNYHSEDIEIFHPSDTTVYSEIFENIYQNWISRINGYKHQCSALLCTMFSMMENNKYNDVLTAKSVPPNLKKSFEYLQKNFTDHDLTVEFLSNLADVSSVYYRRVFNKFFGKTPLKYINEMRINYACELLKSELYSVSEVSEKSGFFDNKYFSTVFKKNIGISPSKYKQGFYLLP